MSIFQRGDLPWFNISYKPKVGPNAGKKLIWRGPVSAYLDSRIADPAFRERSGLPSNKTSVLGKKEIERFIEPLARQDWVKYALGQGPDPREPYVAEGAAGALTVNQLLDLWWAAKREHVDKPAKRSDRNKFTFVKRWFAVTPSGAERPASDLLDVSTYDEFTRFMTSTRDAKKTTVDRYIAQIVRPAVYWAMFGQDKNKPLLDRTQSPFGKHGVSTSAKKSGAKKRTRVIEHDEQARVFKHIDRFISEGSDAATRLKLFLVAMVSLATRPFELAAVRVKDINFAKSEITLRAETTKSGNERILPFNPEGELAQLLKPFRFGDSERFLFFRDGKLPEVEGVESGKRLTLEQWRDVAANFMSGTRDVWLRAVIRAVGGDIETVRSKKGKGGTTKLSSRALKVYKSADMVVRDFRRTAASRWKELGMSEEHTRYMLGHAGPITADYALDQQRKAVRAALAATAWAAENEARAKKAQRSVV